MSAFRHFEGHIRSLRHKGLDDFHSVFLDVREPFDLRFILLLSKTDVEADAFQLGLLLKPFSKAIVPEGTGNRCGTFKQRFPYCAPYGEHSGKRQSHDISSRLPDPQRILKVEEKVILETVKELRRMASELTVLHTRGIPRGEV